LRALPCKVAINYATQGTAHTALAESPGRTTEPFPPFRHEQSSSEKRQRREKEEIPSMFKTPHPIRRRYWTVLCTRGDRRAREQVTAGGGEQDAILTGASTSVGSSPSLLLLLLPSDPSLKPIDCSLGFAFPQPSRWLRPRAITSKSLRLVAQLAMCRFAARRAPRSIHG